MRATVTSRLDFRRPKLTHSERKTSQIISVMNWWRMSRTRCVSIMTTRMTNRRIRFNVARRTDLDQDAAMESSRI